MAEQNKTLIIEKMNCTFRYMLRQLVWPLFFAVIAISGIVWMSQSLRFVDLVLNRGLPSYNLFHLAFLVLPMFTSVFLPIILFGVIIFSYTRMNMDSELVIWRAAGISPLRLAAPGLSAAMLVVILCYALNLYFMPGAYRQFKDIQHAIRNNYSQVLLREGAFNEIGTGLTVYIRERGPNGELFGILAHDRRNKGQPITVMAERGAMVNTDNGPRVVMIKGNRQSIKRTGDDLSILYFDRYTLDLHNQGTKGGPRWREPKERFLHELFQIRQSGPHAASDKRYELKLYAEGHQRLASPLLALAFTLLALSALLTGDFKRGGQGSRIIAATLFMLVTQAINISLFSFAGSSFMAVPFMYLLPISIICACAWILFREKSRLRPTTRPPTLSAKA
jgi:lipopolysaccharide export system permease protein